MFVEYTDVSKPPYQLPPIEADDVTGTFDPYVDEQERLCLIDLLGQKLYDDFITGLAGPPNPIWTNLAVGVEYEYQGKKYNWKGMDKMLTPFIYRAWSKDTLIDSLTNQGVQIAKVENAEVVSASRKMVKAQNDFATLAGYDRCQLFDTLYGYLYTSGETYKVSYEAAGYTSIQKYLDERFKFPGLSNTFNI